LIAEVLGAKVYKNLHKEIGWFDIMLTEEGKTDPLLKGLSMNTKVFHWHGDTFDLPSHAKHISYSEACKNQAFLYNNHVLGLQFHLEVTENSIKAMLHHGIPELKDGKFIQSEQQILSIKKYIEMNNKAMFQLLDNLVGYDIIQ
jgi:GMP synthase-like glutamine amidotransferase